MTSSNISIEQLSLSQKLSDAQGIGKEALITTSTRELVEFYWSSRKRFSGGYADFPSKTIDRVVKWKLAFASSNPHV